MEAGLSDPILKGTHPRTIPSRVGFIWFRGLHLNLLLWNRWTILNQTWKGWSLGGSLSKLCQTAPPPFKKTAVTKNRNFFNCLFFSNNSLLEWREELSNTILKGTHPRTIPPRFGVIWFSGFRGEDLNKIFYQNKIFSSETAETN
jgi:hypothetical protein